MPTAEKQARVEKLAAMMAEAQAIYLSDFTGIDVASDTVLRRKLRESGARHLVVKSRLARLAAERAGVCSLGPHLVGPTSVTLATSDPVGTAKILHDFAVGGGKLAVKAGYVGGQVLTPEQVIALAQLPPREEMLAKLVGAVQGPLYALAGVLTALLRGVVGVLTAIQDRKRSEESYSSAAPAEG